MCYHDNGKQVFKLEKKIIRNSLFSVDLQYFANMADDELEALRAQRMAQLQSQYGVNGQNE